MVILPPDRAMADGASPSVSIIVSTFDRLPHLRRLLDSLSHLESDDFELVIVNGPSRDGTAAFLGQWPYPFKLRECPEANLSRSRNIGIAAATGDILVFIDDDAVPADAGWIEAYRAFFARPSNANCAAVGGLVINALTGEREFYRGSTSEYAEQSPQDGSPFRPRSGAWVVQGVMGCNCAMRAAMVREVGGFDENLPYYLDETDLCFRLSDAGHEIGFLEDNAVLHRGATSAVRRSLADKDWRTIFRSDTYFCLKNSRDGTLKKLFRIARAAPKKHFFFLAFHYRPKLRLKARTRIAGFARSVAGIAQGLVAGLLGERKLWRGAPEGSARVRFKARRPARKLRIGLVSRLVPGAGAYGGPGQHTDALAKGLYGLGHEVHLFVRPDTPLPSVGVDFSIHQRPARMTDVGSYRADLPSTSIRLAEAIDYRRAVETEIEKGTAFDFIIGCNWDLETIEIVRAGLCPVVLFLVTPLAMNLELGTFPENEDNFLWNSLDRWQVCNAAVKCVPSDGLVTTYGALLGLAEDELQPLLRIPLGIERTFLPPLAPAPKRRLLFVGRLEKRKGIHTLLSALPAVLEAFPDWECHVVGEDRLPFAGGAPIKDRFQRRHAGARWMKRVVFHGQVSGEVLHEHYRLCDVFVVPAIYESFGLAYHEAMQYAKPVVACRAGGMPETVRDGQEGLLVAPEDVGGLQEALHRLMGDAALRERMGQAAAERIRLEDNHESFARRVEAALTACRHPGVGREERPDEDRVANFT